MTDPGKTRQTWLLKFAGGICLLEVFCVLCPTSVAQLFSCPQRPVAIPDIPPILKQYALFWDCMEEDDLLEVMGRPPDAKSETPFIDRTLLKKGQYPQFPLVTGTFPMLWQRTSAN